MSGGLDIAWLSAAAECEVAEELKGVRKKAWLFRPTFDP